MTTSPRALTFGEVAEEYDRWRPGYPDAPVGWLAPASPATVVEIGAGNGRNFGRYPPAVTAVTAVEPEPHLRQLAVRAASAAPVPVTVLPGLAEALPLTAASCDAAVLCLVLCSLPDRDAALAEITRVLGPVGRTTATVATAAVVTHGVRRRGDRREDRRDDRRDRR